MRRISAKITRTRRKSFTSIRCTIVRHYRRPTDGRPSYETLAKFPSVRSNAVNDLLLREGFHRAVDVELIRLSLLGYMRNDLLAIKRKLSQIVPPVPKIPAGSVKSVAPLTVEGDREAKSGLEIKYPILAE